MPEVNLKSNRGSADKTHNLWSRRTRLYFSLYPFLVMQSSASYLSPLCLSYENDR